MIYHVLNRANAQLTIFEKDEDYEAFERVRSTHCALNYAELVFVKKGVRLQNVGSNTNWTASLSCLVVTRSVSEGSTSENSLAYASGYDFSSLSQ